MKARVMPRDQIVSDTRKVVYYYRASPDGTRVLFGGRVSHNETDPRISGPRLHAPRNDPHLSRAGAGAESVIPGLDLLPTSFDEMMHVGEREGLYYAIG